MAVLDHLHGPYVLHIPHGKKPATAPYTVEASATLAARREPDCKKERKTNMLKIAAIAVMSLGLAATVMADRRDTLVRFDGGIGVIPASSAAGTANPDGTFPDVNRNVVRGVNPPGSPWRIADLKADVDIFGRIRVRGRGLLLAGSNGIGTNA